jgi:hypothetical protein
MLGLYCYFLLCPEIRLYAGHQRPADVLRRFPTITYLSAARLCALNWGIFHSVRFFSFACCVLWSDNILILVYCCCFVHTHTLDGGLYLEKHNIPFKNLYVT